MKRFTILRFIIVAVTLFTSLTCSALKLPPGTTNISKSTFVKLEKSVDSSNYLLKNTVNDISLIKSDLKDIKKYTEPDNVFVDFFKDLIKTAITNKILGDGKSGGWLSLIISFLSLLGLIIRIFFLRKNNKQKVSTNISSESASVDKYKVRANGNWLLILPTITCIILLSTSILYVTEDKPSPQPLRVDNSKTVYIPSTAQFFDSLTALNKKINLLYSFNNQQEKRYDSLLRRIGNTSTEAKLAFAKSRAKLDAILASLQKNDPVNSEAERRHIIFVLELSNQIKDYIKKVFIFYIILISYIGCLVFLYSFYKKKIHSWYHRYKGGHY